MDTNTLLWIGQILLALAFLGAGAGHAFGYERMVTQPRLEWMSAVGAQNMRIVGILEMVGAVGLILPAATGILAWLTPTAAAALGILMVFAIVFHARRPGEGAGIVINAVLGVIAFVIAYGRFVVEPL